MLLDQQHTGDSSPNESEHDPEGEVTLAEDLCRQSKQRPQDEDDDR